MKTIKATYYITVYFLCFFNSNTYSQVDTKKIDSDIDFIMNSQATACTIPLYNTFSGDIENVNNITEAKYIDLKNNDGGMVYIQGNVYYSPQDPAKISKKELEEIIGPIISKEFDKREQSLKDIIKEGENDIITFGELLKSDEISLEKKEKGLEALKKYRKSIDAIICLNNDYGNEAIVKTDEDGNKNYLFDLEKIKNDPNYYFIDDESEGFSVAKKFNRYGYISHSNVYTNIPFKYTRALPFFNGYAISSDNNYRYVLNKKGEEILTFKKENVDSISVLINDTFIVHKRMDSTHLIKRTGEIISKMYHNISVYGESNSVLLAKEERDGITPLLNDKYISRFINLNGKEFSIEFDCKTSFEKCLFSNTKKNEKCDFTIEDILVLPHSNKALFIFTINRHFYTKYLILKNLQSKEVLTCVKKNITTNNPPTYFPIKYFSDSLNYENSSDIIIGSSDNTSLMKKTFELKKDKSITFPSAPNERTLINQNIFFNISQNKMIGDYCYSPIGVVPERKLLIFSNPFFKENDLLQGYGVMDFYGLTLIPPLFKNINYNQAGKDQFVVTDYFGEVFKINVEGECLEDCEQYNLITKNYFTFLAELDEIIQKPKPIIWTGED